MKSNQCLSKNRKKQYLNGKKTFIRGKENFENP